MTSSSTWSPATPNRPRVFGTYRGRDPGIRRRRASADLTGESSAVLPHAHTRDRSRAYGDCPGRAARIPRGVAKEVRPGGSAGLLDGDGAGRGARFSIPQYLVRAPRGSRFSIPQYLVR